MAQNRTNMQLQIEVEKDYIVDAHIEIEFEYGSPATFETPEEPPFINWWAYVDGYEVPHDLITYPSEQEILQSIEEHILDPHRAE